jgi:prefoldin subunit 5
MSIELRNRVRELESKIEQVNEMLLAVYKQINALTNQTEPTPIKPARKR